MPGTTVTDALPTQYGAITIKEVSWLTGLSEWAVRGAVERGELKAYRGSSGPKGHWYVARDVLVRYMTTCGIPLDISLRGRARSGTPPADFSQMKQEMT